MYLKVKNSTETNFNILRYSVMGVFWLIVSIFFTACTETINTEIPTGNYKFVKEIPAPEGYARDTLPKNSFAFYLGNLPLKKDKTVHLYNGKLKTNQI